MLLKHQRDFKYANWFRQWSGPSVRERLIKFVGDGTAPQNWTPEQWALFGKAFLWKNEGAESVGAYFFPIADVVRGKMVFSPKGIHQAYLSISGSNAFNQQDKSDLLEELNQIQAKFPSDIKQLVAGTEETTMNHSMKSLDITEFDVKADDDGKYPHGVIEGYGSTFGNIDRQGDKVIAGAFKKTIKETGGKVPFVDSHGMFRSAAAVIGRTFELSEDSKGLHFRAFFSEAPTAQEVRLKLREGILDRLSMGYSIVKATPKFEDKPPHMELNEVKLREISVVAIPANDKARVGKVKFDDLGFAPDLFHDSSREFDAVLAQRRWYQHVGKGMAFQDWSEEQVMLYAAGFAEHDMEAPTQAKAFQGLLIDVIGEVPYFIPAAILGTEAERAKFLREQFGLSKDAQTRTSFNSSGSIGELTGSKSEDNPEPSESEPAVDATLLKSKTHLLDEVKAVEQMLAKRQLMADLDALASRTS